MKIKKLRPEFVLHVPDKLVEGVIYISDEFATAGHLCCCGCGEEIFTPLNPAQWQLTKNARKDTISLYPSVGNWKYACRSHYWIKKNQVIDAGPMPEHIIAKVIKRDRRDKEIYVNAYNQEAYTPAKMPDLLTRVYRWISGPWR
jgi:hypothetical protein